ncbi:MAG TPA: hypothetical protein VF209_00865 [Patescibacteria group bacterium]
MKHTLLASYYILLALIIGVKVADTVYKGSITIAQAQTLEVLREEKTSLQNSVSSLTETLANQTAVSTVLASDLTQSFQPITQPVSIEASTELAQR